LERTLNGNVKRGSIAWRRRVEACATLPRRLPRRDRPRKSKP
jgi:hypothetical protein